ncbi:LysR family transcriptional regulator [Pseudomonas sp. RC10]|uniref:LysR family transcriptional regulator n=1 Tax=Pseudomonas bambusae TaxID=3139142 RepID=UPI0031393F00
MINRDHQLRLFLEIANCASVSKAADVLGITQSGLSRQLGSLEAHVGQALFDRHGRGVTLTDTGRKLLAVVSAAYENVDSTLSSLREHQGITEGHLRIATIHTLSYYFVADVMAEFMRQLPLVNMKMLGCSSPHVIEMVENGHSDIGFVYDTAVVSETLEIAHLFEERMALFVHESSPLAALTEVDLTEASPPLIVFPPQYELRRMLRNEGVNFVVAAEVDTVDAMFKLTSLTQGHCVLHASMPDRLLEYYRLKRVTITQPFLSRRIVAITRRGKMKNNLTHLMLALARSSSH